MTENQKKGPFSDPLYKNLSRLNGKINEMSKSRLIEQLELLKLNSTGVKCVLQKRLKAYHKRTLIANPQANINPSYEYFVVIDFEATCDQNCNDFYHEIIEFPAILVDASKKEIVDEFHFYVKPSLNKKLTDFCVELTGIQQEVVDAASDFPEVLDNFENWLKKHELGKTKKFAIVTDGPWDMSRFMFLQCHISKLPLPKWSCKWINIRKSYCNSYNEQRASLRSMLEGLNMEFEGRAHSGISDSRNIARILIQMLNDDCNLYINEKMFATKIDTINKQQLVKNGNRGKFVSVSRREAETIDDDDDDGDRNDNCTDDKLEEYDDQNPEEVSHNKILAKKDKENKLKEDLESCEDLMYYLSLRK